MNRGAREASQQGRNQLMAKSKGKKGSVNVQDLDAKKNPKGGGANKQEYLVVKMTDVIVTSVLPAVQDTNKSK